MKLLELDQLCVSYEQKHVTQEILHQISLYVEKGESIGLVGASGCGKSQMMRAVLDLLSKGGKITAGNIKWLGKGCSKQDCQALRGHDIAMMFQDPQMALDPVMNIQQQLIETILTHQSCDKKQAKQQCIEVLQQVKIADPKRVLKQRPFQLSIGMCQRIMIAMLLMQQNASLWIVDEPTSSLDGIVQADILDLLKQLQRERTIAMIFITHDLRLLPMMCQRVYVMEEGCIVESCDAKTLFSDSHHPSTQAMLEALRFTEDTKEK